MTAPAVDVIDEIIADGETVILGITLPPLPAESLGSIGVGAPVRSVIVIPLVVTFAGAYTPPSFRTRNVIRSLREVSANIVSMVPRLVIVPSEAGSFLTRSLIGITPIAMASISHLGTWILVTGSPRKIADLG